MARQSTGPLVKGVPFFLAHAPGLVPFGSKPVRELRKDPSVRDALHAHLCLNVGRGS